MDFHKRLIEEVEKQFGKKVAYQRDCKTLSEKVFDKTNEYISPATLRRLFGFLSTNSKPSRVTLDILSRYCEFKDWQDFIDKQHIPSAQQNIDAHQIWLHLFAKCTEITEHSLRTIQIKSGIPFETTVRRNNVEHLLSHFLESGKTAFALIGPGGYGKSTLIANWHKFHLSNKNETIATCIISASKLEQFSYSNLNIDEWLWGQVGIDPLSYPKFYDEIKNLPGKVLFIFDALDEVSLHGIKQEKLLKGIHELASEFSKVANLKFIITSRTSTWKQLQGYITDQTIWMNIEPEAFNSDGANIPPLNYDEIQSVLDNTINKKNKFRILVFEMPPQQRNTIAYPFYLQLFINSYDPNHSKQLSDPYSIINFFIQKKITESVFSDEMFDILTTIANSFVENGKAITKKELKRLYPIHLKTAGSYYDAYHEMVSFGIISEEKNYSTSLGYNTLIKTSDAKIASSIIAQELISKYDFSPGLIEFIANNYWEDNSLDMLTGIIFNLAYNQKKISFLKQLIEKAGPSISSEIAQTLLFCAKRDISTVKELSAAILNNPHISNELFITNPDINETKGAFRKMLEFIPQKNKLHRISVITNAYLNILSAETNRIDWKEIESIGNNTNELPPQHMAMFYSCILFLSEDKMVSKWQNKIVECYSNIKDASSKAKFREVIIPLHLINKRFKPLNDLFTEKLDVSAHQSALGNILETFNNVMNGQGFISAKSHNRIMQDYSQLNPNRNHIGIAIGEVSRAISYFHESNLKAAHQCIRNAIELCGISGFRLPEIILMKLLGNTMIRMGEKEHGEKFISYTEDLIAQTGMYEFKSSLCYDI
ncbi:NACHT domain-containing protein [Tenuifilum thalassicum]|uniref:NACHT domain-containing protein n=1 Tax=Tenuifilum thalassicum TaxID=2590900 RepID=A0A7D3XF78_9BACT|nr:NACHT domain-containing protein [Tenuifilum thalassicum]QKG80587.1 NACHT domain-containing protein [Tenuifilum thalassicum]